MNTDWLKIILSGSLLFFMVACSAAPAQPAKQVFPPDTPLPTTPSQVKPGQPPPAQGTDLSVMATSQPNGPAVPSGLDAQILQARQDLAQKLKIPVESVTVSSVIGQEFTAAAFQCGKATERIAKDPPPESITGFSILLKALGHRYEYHATEKVVVFCRGEGG
jgi:hypothetical protein